MVTIDSLRQAPLLDSDRLGMIRLALVRAYGRNDQEAIIKVAQQAQKYVDEGGEDYREIDYRLEDYTGADPEKLTDKYILRLLRDRHCDDDDDQEYIATGLTKAMRMQPVQLSFDF